MNVIETRLPSLKIIEPAIHADLRGFFMESYHQSRYVAHGVAYDFTQDNHSMSVEQGVLRGLHYQLSPMAQAKLVRVVVGAIYDVAVDIRRDSPTFGQWEAVVLSAENKRQLLVPHGFAHGFCTLAQHSEVLYKVDSPYSPELERGIAWDDPALGIDWPTDAPILSEKDKKHPPLLEAELNFIFEG